MKEGKQNTERQKERKKKQSKKERKSERKKEIKKHIIKQGKTWKERESALSVLWRAWTRSGSGLCGKVRLCFAFMHCFLYIASMPRFNALLLRFAFMLCLLLGVHFCLIGFAGLLGELGMFGTLPPGSPGKRLLLFQRPSVNMMAQAMFC